MAKFSDIQAGNIGRKFGTAISEFSTASSNAIEQVLINWCNDSVSIMQSRIRTKVRTHGASTLAQSIHVMPAVQKPGQISVAIESEVDYWDYVDKGVRGVKKNKAPKSKYKFKTIGAGPKMIASFKKYIAKTGTKNFGGRKLVQKNKNKQANAIDTAAKQMAVYTKIGGIRPVGFVEKAVNNKTKNELIRNLKAVMSGVITVQITR